MHCSISLHHRSVVLNGPLLTFSGITQPLILREMHRRPLHEIPCQFVIAVNIKMRRLLLLSAAFLNGYAGTVGGVVVEHISGRPMARALVRLDPAPQPNGDKLIPLTTRAGRSGAFTFPVVAPGIYLLTALRDGYFPASYGQRLPIGRGIPFEVTADSNTFAELRLRHKGAITGRVLDENGVGTAGTPVVAYRARLPLRSAGHAMSDDRGVYRIPGLEPGKYWVRSAAFTLEDGSGWLPTFGPQARESREARIHPVAVDADTTDADLNPEPGRLFRFGGKVQCTGSSVIVTLSSETGRQTTKTDCANGYYRFEGVAPGVYEVFAVVDSGNAAGYIELFVDRDSENGNVQALELPNVTIDVVRAGSNAPPQVPVQLIGRRQDLSETETTSDIPLPRAKLAPGHWEFQARVPDGQYVQSIRSSYSQARRLPRGEDASDWFAVFIEPRTYNRLAIAVSDQAAQIAGSVKKDGAPVVAAPVFLWPVDQSARRSLGGPRQTLTDTSGNFHFGSLPPGDYRLLASFDVNEIDEELIDLSRAPVIHCEASQTAGADLPIWIAP